MRAISTNAAKAAIALAIGFGAYATATTPSMAYCYGPACVDDGNSTPTPFKDTLEFKEQKAHHLGWLPTYHQMGISGDAWKGLPRDAYQHRNDALPANCNDTGERDSQGRIVCATQPAGG